jgi:hypothetical protein
MVLGQMIEQTLAMMIRRTAAIGIIIFKVTVLIPVWHRVNGQSVFALAL